MVTVIAVVHCSRSLQPFIAAVQCSRSLQPFIATQMMLVGRLSLSLGPKPLNIFSVSCGSIPKGIFGFVIGTDSLKTCGDSVSC